MGLRHGGKKLFEQIEAHEDAAIDEIRQAREDLRFNPDLAVRHLERAITAIHRARQIRNEDIAKLIQRAAPALATQVDDHEERLSKVELQLQILLAEREGRRLELPAERA